MTNSNLIVRELTRDDLIGWYGDTGVYPTFKGFAFQLDGEVIGIGGLHFTQGLVIAFSDGKPECKKFKISLHKTALRLFAEAGKRHKRIIALQGVDEPSAPRWLSRLGFKKISEGLWQWRN